MTVNKIILEEFTLQVQGDSKQQLQQNKIKAMAGKQKVSWAPSEGQF